MHCCIIHQLLWFMYRGVFTVGVAVTEVLYTADGRRQYFGGNGYSSATALTDYSYISVRDGYRNDGATLLARCLTGLGPTNTSNGTNGALGGLYFNGSMIHNSPEPLRSYDRPLCYSDVVASIPGRGTAGVINIHLCEHLYTAKEGIYTCTMMNSSMMNESVRFGIYFSIRSESLDLYIPSLVILYLSTQLLH